MAYGQFTDYSQTGPGVYQFGTTGGQPVTLSGPPAEDLKAKIDASNAAGQVAMNWGGPAAPNTGEQFARPKPPPSRLDAGGPGPVAPPPAQPPPPAAEPVPPARPKLQLEAQGKRGENILKDPVTGEVFIRTPARAGTKGGAQETGRSIKGGFDPNEDYIDQQLEANVDARMAEDTAYEGRMQSNAEAIGQLKADIDTKRMQAEEAAMEAAQVEQGVADKQRVYDEARERYKSTTIDTRRVQRDPLAHIGLILGTLGAHFPGAKQSIPNYAQQILNKRIDDDIRKQETELAVKKDAAGNALGDLQRQLGSRALAKDALRGIMLERSQSQIALEAERAKTPELQAQYMAWGAENQKRLSEQLEKYRQEAAGETTRTIKNVQATAGTRGGDRPLTLEERKKYADVQTAERKARGEGEAAGKPTPQAQKAQALEGEAAVQADRLEQYKDEESAPTPETKGIVKRAGRGAYDVVFGEGQSSRDFDTDRDRAMVQDVEDAKSFIKSARSVMRAQGALTDKESQMADKGLAPGATVGEVKRAMAGLRESLRKISQQKGGAAAQPSEAPQE